MGPIPLILYFLKSPELQLRINQDVYKVFCSVCSLIRTSVHSSQGVQHYAVNCSGSPDADMNELLSSSQPDDLRQVFLGADVEGGRVDLFFPHLLNRPPFC